MKKEHILTAPILKFDNVFIKITSPKLFGNDWEMEIHLKKNTKIENCVHFYTDTFITCESGKGKLIMENKEFLLEKGVRILIRMDVYHSIEASNEGLVISSISSGFIALSGSGDSLVDIHFSDEKENIKWHKIFNEIKDQVNIFKQKLTEQGDIYFKI